MRVRGLRNTVPPQFMRPHALIYNIIAILIAGLFFICAISTWFIVMPPAPPQSQGFFKMIVFLFACSMLLLATGATVNLTRARTTAWATVLTMLGYTILIWTLPFAIWGGVLLYLQRRSAATIPPSVG